MGLFITMEGPDGSGKSLQMDLLEQDLEQRGFDIVRTREPGGTRISERIRDLLLDPECAEMDARTEALLYAAARAQHTAERIRPALEAGRIVLCDRFTDSSLVYQGIGRGLGVEEVAAFNHFATGGLAPDLTILLQIDYEEGLRRKNRQYDGHLDRMELQQNDFHHKVHDGFAVLQRLYPERIRMVDGSDSPEEVHKHIMEIVEPLLSGVGMTTDKDERRCRI
ncbi:MAG: dTMP kinase [Firmicutes bacterium]|nr:dTMP kinase [Bacillota bacterium]